MTELQLENNKENVNLYHFRGTVVRFTELQLEKALL